LWLGAARQEAAGAHAGGGALPPCQLAVDPDGRNAFGRLLGSVKLAASRIVAASNRTRSAQ
jgi:hypothetical protein